MEPYTRKIVITGGPGTGKSSVIGALRDRGYTTIDEAAMPIKEAEQRKKEAGLPYILPENDNAGFQRLIYSRQIELERNAYGTTFVDRGLIDNIGYCRRFNTAIAPELELLCKSVAYEKVFIMDPLPSSCYKNECARDESAQESAHLGELIGQAYQDYGHKIVRVPYMDGANVQESIDLRVQYILDHIGGA